jgi:hypothetical protein
MIGKIVFTRNLTPVARQSMYFNNLRSRSSTFTFRFMHSSLHESTFTPHETDYNNDEYGARQFGYRVVMASPNWSNGDFMMSSLGTERLEYPIGTNVDIISSPEIQRILSSRKNHCKDISNEQTLFSSVETHVDSGCRGEK